MKFIGKLLLYILIALLVAIAGLYFLLQTRWGAEHISAWVSENSDYHLAFGAMDHRFSAPCRYHPAGKRDAESHRPDRAATVQSRSSATA